MKKAVTLVELIVAIVIISILSALTISKQSSSAGGMVQEANETSFDTLARNMYHNVELIAINYEKGKSKTLSYEDLTTASGIREIIFDSWHNSDTSGNPTYNQDKLHKSGGIEAGAGNYTCEQIFLALSGGDAIGGSGTTGLTCTYTTPGTGETQRTYTYDIQTNELRRAT